MTSKRHEFLDKIAQIKDLPSFPEVVARVMDTIGRTDANLDDLSKIINEDPSLAARMLKVVNSVYFATSYREISSIKEALVRLGFSEVYRICLTSQIIKLFENSKKSIDYKTFWKHSLMVAMTTRLVHEYSSTAGEEQLDTCFTAGLLHDIGVFVLDQFFHDDYVKTQTAVDATGSSCHEIEREMLGLDHGELGGFLLRHWKLPENLIQAVSYHHDPGRAKPEYRNLTQMVHIANFICNNQGFVYAQESIAETFSYGAWHDLGLKVDDIPNVIQDVKEEVDQADLLAFLM